ncbi:hypothetical protein N9J19_00460 [bacterium]|nr:hypothetical protein [bacterium]
MANIFGTGDNKAMQNVIDAASKIMMGVKDSDTDAAQTEDDHPIVAAAKEEVAVESADLDSPAVEKSLKHDCATHVVHKEHGEGRCIPGMHTLEETSELEGVVTHYDVMFAEGIVKDVAVDELEIVAEMSHGHAKKKK